MSSLTQTPVPVFDPYHFPNVTAKSLERDVTFIIYGVAIYELVLCLHVYFTVCTKAKMKTAIFRLITVAVLSLMLSTMVMILLQLNVNRHDPPRTLPEYFLTCLNVVFLVISKYAYYIAATLRTRALLGRFPKILFCFYAMLAISIINNMVLLAFVIDLSTIGYNNPMDKSIVNATNRYQVSASFISIFDMIFANALSVSFLHPIFATIEMKLGPAIRTMIKLGDVQRALVSSASSILFVVFTFGSIDSQLSLAALAVWLLTQSTHFLRLSYLSSFELLKNRSAIRTVSDKNRTNVVPNKNPGGVLPEEIVAIADYM